MLCKDLKSAVKTIVGSCVSSGILIENKPAHEIEQEIDDGKYDKEIKSESTKTPVDKKLKLDEYFSKLKAEQEKILKQEQAAKEAEKEAKPEEAKAEAPADTLKGTSEKKDAKKPKEEKKEAKKK